MNLRVDDNKKVFTAIKKSQQGDHTLWTKMICREKASSLHALDLLAWLLHLHRKEVLTKLSPEVKNLIIITIQREGYQLYPDEIVIEDSLTNVKLD